MYNFQLLTSSGVPSLDALLGGGLPVGTVLLLESHAGHSWNAGHPISEKDETRGAVIKAKKGCAENKAADETKVTGMNYSENLMQYFLAEGAFHEHGIYFGSISGDPER